MDPSVPFKGAYSRMDGATWVNARVSGMVSFEPPALVLQVREQRQRFVIAAAGGTSGILGDDVTTTTRLPLDDLVTVEYRRPALIGARLVITARRMELLDPFRWADGARLKLTVSWRDRAAAAELALAVSNALLDLDLARLESPPPRGGG